MSIDSVSNSSNIVDLFVSLSQAKEETKSFVKVKQVQEDTDKALLQMGHNGKLDTYI